MRGIKYRFWDRATQKMVRWEEVVEQGIWRVGKILTGRQMVGIQVPLMFTGLHDSQGVEIYEGDIVEAWDRTGQKLPLRFVEWRHGAFMLTDLHPMEGGERTTHYIAELHHAMQRGFTCKVTGNVYEELGGPPVDGERVLEGDDAPGVYLDAAPVGDESELREADDNKTLTTDDEIARKALRERLGRFWDAFAVWKEYNSTHGAAPEGAHERSWFNMTDRAMTGLLHREAMGIIMEDLRMKRVAASAATPPASPTSEADEGAPDAPELIKRLNPLDLGDDEVERIRVNFTRAEFDLLRQHLASLVASPKVEYSEDALELARRALEEQRKAGEELRGFFVERWPDLGEEEGSGD